MSKFLVLYRSPMSPQEMFASIPPEQAQAFAKAWLAWDAGAGPALTDPGNPTQEISDPKAGGDHIAGYAIIEADDADAVDKLLTGHPHLANGGTVGIYQVMDMAAPN
ncbi:YciI family protein [Nocardia mexicana]|uniref:YCII-related domain-containing protein n=1 Tax=Nocardia mexicana TaxID=279262 RepID=A0A370H8T7_9NOCA|nr:YciI family protein [Nocardia mexicana]RDI52806.1 YCII-related domain-containing protein [Nocardia mexicana]